jgi:hypothetical protein
MTNPAGVRATRKSDRNWVDLAAELTPVKSLARVDAVTARAVTTITVIGVLLTGLGALSAGLPSYPDLARGLAIAAVTSAALAVASALTAQVLTITRRLRTGNLAEVKSWYHRQFDLRAYPTQAATILLLLAALLAGAAVTASLATTPPTTPTIQVTQRLDTGTSALTGQSTVTAQVTFHDVPPGQAATITITTPGIAQDLGQATATPAPDGTAATSLTISHLLAGRPVIIIARATGQLCQTTINAAKGAPSLSCRTTS